MRQAERLSLAAARRPLLQSPHTQAETETRGLRAQFHLFCLASLVPRGGDANFGSILNGGLKPAVLPRQCTRQQRGPGLLCQLFCLMLCGVVTHPKIGKRMHADSGLSCSKSPQCGTSTLQYTKKTVCSFLKKATRCSVPIFQRRWIDAANRTC